MTLSIRIPLPNTKRYIYNSILIQINPLLFAVSIGYTYRDSESSSVKDIIFKEIKDKDA